MRRVISAILALAVTPLVEGAPPPDDHEAAAPAMPTEPQPPVELGKTFAWESFPGTVTADLDGDGVEDLVGAYVSYDPEVSQIFVAAFRGRDLRPMWRAGPFGLVRDRFDMRVVESGPWIVVLAAGHHVHVLDARTGRDAGQDAPASARNAPCIAAPCEADPHEPWQREMPDRGPPLNG